MMGGLRCLLVCKLKMEGLQSEAELLGRTDFGTCGCSIYRLFSFCGITSSQKSVVEPIVRYEVESF
jgi:hypothetical protein